MSWKQIIAIVTRSWFIIGDNNIKLKVIISESFYKNNAIIIMFSRKSCNSSHCTF